MISSSSNEWRRSKRNFPTSSNMLLWDLLTNSVWFLWWIHRNIKCRSWLGRRYSNLKVRFWWGRRFELCCIPVLPLAVGEKKSCLTSWIGLQFCRSYWLSLIYQHSCYQLQLEQIIAMILFELQLIITHLFHWCILMDKFHNPFCLCISFQSLILYLL